MTYPQLEELPFKIDAAAHYPATKKLEKLFTKKDKYGEEFSMYVYNVIEDAIMVPRNCAPEVTEEQAEEIYRMTVGGTTYDWEDGFVPRDDEQFRMVEESVALLLGGGRAGHIMQAPTGYGKTYLGAAVIQRIGVRSLVITTKDDILGDWKIALGKTLKISPDKIGEWRGDIVPEPHHEVVVGLVQSVCKGLERYSRGIYESFGLVLVDEVQRMGADKFSQAMWHLPARYRIGLSATPYRKDGRERLFHAHIGQVEVITEERKLVPKVICVDTEWDVPSVWQYDPTVGKSVFGPLEIPWGRTITCVKHLKDDEYRNSIIVDFLKACVKKGRTTVVLSDTVEHLRLIAEACVNAGMPEDIFGWYTGLNSGVYGKVKDGYPPPREQREQATLAPITLATFKMCGEGTNVPWWDTEILATPKADVEQPVGRILREWDGKYHPLVLDLCDYGHMVLATFCGSRRKWYKSIGAEIVDR